MSQFLGTAIVPRLASAPASPTSGQVYYDTGTNIFYMYDGGTSAWVGLTKAINAKGYVNHGATAGTARPSGYASIEWIGTVEPTNAINGDTWVNTT